MKDLLRTYIQTSEKCGCYDGEDCMKFWERVMERTVLKFLQKTEEEKIGKCSKKREEQGK